jgi:hypothetical protein
MKGHRGIIAVALVLGAAACGSSERAPIEPSASQDEAAIDAVLGRPFTLEIGQSAEVANTNLTVRFLAVPADSRCPTDVQCVWSGNARVDLRTGGVDRSLNSHEEPRATDVGEYRIELIGLAPQPKSTESIAPASYSATLIVTRPGA